MSAPPANNFGMNNQQQNNSQNQQNPGNQNMPMNQNQQNSN
jgi:hypothetical protein